MPISNILSPPSAQLPKSTPSVPTFMAHMSCLTTNCLNVKQSFISVAVISLVTKVIIFSVTDNVSTDIIAAKSLQIVFAATMLLHDILHVASYMKDETAKLSAMAFNMILKRDLVIS